MTNEEYAGIGQAILDQMYSPDMKAWVMQMVHSAIDQRTSVAREGTVVGGSWDPSDHSVAVLLGDTYANDSEDGDTFAAEARVPLVSGHPSEGNAPRGNERVMLIPTQSGYAALLHSGPDDAPLSSGNKPGERQVGHRNASGQTDAYITHLNDAQPGDGKGATKILAGGLYHVATAGGLTFSMNDQTGLIEIGSDSLGTADSVITQTDLQNALNTIMTYINAHAHNGVQSGSGVSGAPVSSLSVTARGSSVVESKE